MKVIKATQQMLETRTLVIGFQGENLRTQVRIDCSPTFAEYPNATPALAIKPSSGETYPVFVERDGNEVVWDIVANNLVLKGDGELQLTFYKDNVIAKTSIGHITVNRSLQIDGEMPDVVATWIENANRKLAEVDAVIVSIDEMDAVASGLPEGADPTVEVSMVNDHKRLSFGIPKGDTGEKGDKGDKGDRGEVGATPQVGIGTVQTLPAGSSATASMSGTTENPLLNLGIPQGIQGVKGDRGEKGETGATGATGATPDLSIGTVSTLPAGSSATAEITGTPENPVLSFGIPQGIQGEKGDKGDPGDGVPVGGLKGQVLAKASDADRVTEWIHVAPVIKNEASGAIASFPDGADGHLVDSLKVQIEPVQDLHGYDNPWPAGGGKNILPFIGRNETKSGITVSYDESDQTYILNGTTTSNTNIDLSVIPREQLPLYNAPLARYVMSVEQVSGSMTIAEGSGITFAVAVFNDANNDYFRGDTSKTSLTNYYGTANRAINTTDAYHLMIQLWRVGTVLNNVKLRIQIVNTADSTELWTAWTPYSNICPITGWDGVKVTRTGKNLVNPVTATEGYFVRAGNGSAESPLGSVIANVSWVCSDYIPVKPNTAYTQTLPQYNGATAAGLVFFKSKDISGAISGVPTATQAQASYTFTTPSNCYFIRISWNVFNLPADREYVYPQVEEGAKTAYEPYNGTTLPISWQSSAGTVYGGELTVNADGSGSLVVDSINYDVSNDTSWGIAGSTLGGTYFYKRVTTDAVMPLYTAQEIALAKTNEKYSCGHIQNPYDHAENCAWVYRASDGGYLRIGFSSEMGIDTVEKFNDWRANNTVQIYYPLLNSTTYTLTAPEIRTLLGTNNVWSDAGDVSVKYNADTKLYIDNKITQAIAAALNS